MKKARKFRMVCKYCCQRKGLGEEGELKAQMLNKPQMFIEVQILNSALLPLFRQTLVVCRISFSSRFHILKVQ